MVNKDNTELGEKLNEILDAQEAEGVWDGWYKDAQEAANISTLDELGYDDEGNKITE